MNQAAPPKRTTQHLELGHFIRQLRESTRPDALGLPGSDRRRTPGLRREELAALCGISVTWLTWLEQGRAVHASTSALVQLADALRLDHANRHYLFELAGRPDPDVRPPEFDQLPRLLRVVDEMNCPAYALDVWWTIRAANKRARQLFSNWGQGSRSKVAPNLIHYVFLNPLARQLLVDWKASAERLVAEFRADLGAIALQPEGEAFVHRLSQQSAEFATLWKRQQVADRTGGARSFNHPVKGLVHCEQVTLRTAMDPSLKVVMLMDSTLTP